LFSALGEFKDAPERTVEVGYILANQFAANENYGEAVKLFASFGDYKNSIALKTECVSRLLNNASVGDIVYFGTYEQDGNAENGAEPISWIVLGKTDDHCLLLSEYIIEKMRYGEREYSHFWKTSSARAWLNDEFCQGAFSADENNMIQNMITSDETEDRLFLLSAEEARGLFPSDDQRIAFITEYMDSQDFEGIYGYEGQGAWWTRSVSTASNGKGVVIVTVGGSVRSTGCAPNVPNQYSSQDVGMRPALCISLSGETTAEAQNMSLFGVDSNRDLDNEPNKWRGGSSGGYSNSGGKCAICNGTGYVRYYYGSSDLEAWLSGHDAYTVGQCTSCGGTGK